VEDCVDQEEEEGTVSFNGEDVDGCVCWELNGYVFNDQNQECEF